MSNPQLDHLYQVFELYDDWSDRYRHLLELAKDLAPIGEDERIEENRVTGCLSQVWLIAEPASAGEGGDVMVFRADSDARLVQGLIAVILMLYSGRSASYVLQTDAREVFARLGLDNHLSVGRRNGVESMIQRIKALAQIRLEA